MSSDLWDELDSLMEEFNPKPKQANELSYQDIVDHYGLRDREQARWFAESKLKAAGWVKRMTKREDGKPIAVWHKPTSVNNG